MRLIRARFRYRFLKTGVTLLSCEWFEVFINMNKLSRMKPSFYWINLCIFCDPLCAIHVHAIDWGIFIRTSSLIHCDYGVRLLCEHYLRKWLVAFLVPSHYLNFLPEPMLICCKLDPRNKLQWQLNKDMLYFGEENIFEIVCKMSANLFRSHCAKY